MYYRKFIEFLKEHGIYNEEVFNYFYENSTRFDYLDDEWRPFIGVYYQTNGDVLSKIKTIVPYINDDKTVLINIHEYIHVYMIYNKINDYVKIKTLDREVLPIFFEKVYVKENPTDELIKYQDYLDESIYNAGEEEYLLALKLSDELMNEYDNQSVGKLNFKVKKLMFRDRVNKMINK